MRKLLGYFTWIEKSLHILGYIAAFIMMLLITADTAGRYFFNAPIRGTFEVTQMYLMVMIIFLSLSYSYQNESHVRIDILYSRFSSRLRLAVDIIGIILTFIIFSFIFYESYILTLDAWQTKQYTFGVISMPLYLSYIWIPIGTGILLIRFIIEFFRKILLFKTVK